MKEASGELNMTVFVVVAIGILSVFFYTIIWPMIRNTFVSTSKCSDAVCDASTVTSNGMVTCAYYKDGNKVGNDFKCVWKG